MKNLSKIIGRACVGARTASLLPYCVRKDKETGGFEVRSLLWAVKKIPGEERDRYVLDLLPFVGGKEEPAEEAEAPVEEPVEAPAEEETEAPAEPCCPETAE